MNRIVKHRPIQAGDYGRETISPSPRCEVQKQIADLPQTDGQKTLSLWSH